MKRLSVKRHAVLAASLVLMAPWAMAMDADELKARLGLIEGWRLAPVALADYCEDIDPEGVSLREQRYQQWQARHAALAASVKQTFELLVPVAHAVDKTMAPPLEELRGRIMMDVLNTLFFAKSDAGARAVCRNYIGSAASNNVEPVQQSLVEIEKWRAANLPAK